MNRVQFSMPQRNISISKLMAPPKNISDISSWIRSARKVIPQIPDVLTRTDWRVHSEVISDKHILLEIRDVLDNKCALIIERRSTMSR